jgi:exopolyphosphatase/guanosine-5'-triphosphate,3'-diphosphate pyrophosphatase
VTAAGGGGGTAPPGAGLPLVAAVIDVGSNSVLLLTVAVDGAGRARAIDEGLATTRLGAGLVRGGRLDPAARVRTREAVVAFAARARAAAATDVWAFATAAMREAADGSAFAGELEAAAGVPVEVLSGESEARLAYAAVVHGLGVDGGPVLVADLGGRTTELTLGTGEAIVAAESLPLGALALTETCLPSDPPAPAEICRLIDEVDAALAASALPPRAATEGARLVASGGTATALAALDLGLGTYDGRRVHGHVLTSATLDALAARLVALPVAARASLAGLDPGRATILPAGAVVLGRIAAAAAAATVTVSDHGVRHAYLRAHVAATGTVASFAALWP